MSACSDTKRLPKRSKAKSGSEGWGFESLQARIIRVRFSTLRGFTELLITGRPASASVSTRCFSSREQLLMSRRDE